MGSLHRLRALALAEVRRASGTMDRRTGAVALGLAVLLGVVAPAALQGGVAFDQGLYRVAIAEGNPLLPAVLEAPTLQRVSFDGAPHAAVAAGRADVAVEGLGIVAADSAKGRAAAGALQRAVADRTERLLAREPDQAAAFPVQVTVAYLAQDRPAGEADSGGVGPRGAAPSVPPKFPSSGPPAPGSGAAGLDLLPPERASGAPESLAAPFPFRALLLAYVFLIPMNFVVQVYAGSVLGERLNRRGEALLASPARPWELVVGKALPYFGLMMLVNAAIALALGAGWLTALAVAPVALAFLALEFLAAMVARSFRELTFFTVFISVMLTVYAFLPAVFAQLHPVALVSPITLVVMDLRGSAPTPGQALYATLPLTALAGVLFLLGAALYREEDLFHQKTVRAKAVDALARQVRGAASGFKLSVLLLPLVLVAELMLVALLAVWPAEAALAGVLVGVAVVEELCKGLPAFAALRTGALPARRALRFGALAGVGFFLAEKGFLLASLAGLFDLPAGQAVFAGAGAAALGATGVLAVALLAAPLLLHLATATLSAWGARAGGAVFAVALALAVVVHAGYDLAIVRFLGGG